ncbi:MAG: helix-turn-helix transcriptional regulator [Acidiferrobacterales bacterium]
MDVKTLCLGVLTFGEMTGYDIKKHFEEAFSHFFPASFGSIYPALAELTHDGFVTCQDVAQDKRPDKKVYRITDKGRQLLREALVKTPPRHKVRSEFLVLLYFAHLLPTEHLASVLDKRAADIKALLSLLQEAEQAECPLPSHDFVVGLGRVTLQAQLSYIEKKRASLMQAMPAQEHTTEIA